jgi:1-acyl-sn-glycerol-3-phosphate acyltransferase
MLMPSDIDYLHRGIAGRVRTAFAHRLAKRFLNRILKSGKMVIRSIEGLENLASLNSGAIITCNHFNPFDSFALHYAYMMSGNKRRLYRVIREGNYTSFGGFYGFLMRNFHTLPLSSNIKTLAKFSSAVNSLLCDGALISVYPEGSMWYNYRKPKPLKTGAFLMAAKAAVPVLPVFITMRDSDVIGEDGYPIQEYKIHIAPPIYPDSSVHYREDAQRMKDENSAIWSEIYERNYGAPPMYSTEFDQLLADVN